MNIKEIASNYVWDEHDRESLSLFARPRRMTERLEVVIKNVIKDLEADLRTASTRDTAQLELIGKLGAENKRLREVVETMALPAWEDSDVESLFENLRQYAIDALSKDS